MKNIVISNIKKFHKIKDKFIKDGFENLYFVADFDRTITKQYLKNGDFVSSLISILRDEKYLSKNYADNAHKLFEHYHSIEMNQKIPEKDKQKAMEEWWEKHFKLLIKSKLNKKDIEKSSKSKRIVIRDKIFETINLLNQNNVPFLIFSSSGLGDESIEQTMIHHNFLRDNIDIISNRFV